MRVITLLLVLAFLSGCGLTKGLRKQAKADRLVERALRLDPAIYERMDRDSAIVFVDTTVTDSIFIDSTFVLAPIDTIVLVDTITETEAILIRELDTFYLQVTSPSDTFVIRDTVIVKVQDVSINTKKYPGVILWMIRWWWAVLAIIAATWIILKLLEKFKPW